MMAIVKLRPHPLTLAVSLYFSHLSYTYAREITNTVYNFKRKHLSTNFSFFSFPLTPGNARVSALKLKQMKEVTSSGYKSLDQHLP